MATTNVVAYYTKDTPYEDEYIGFWNSLPIELRSKTHVYKADSEGSWVLNCGLKPDLIYAALKMLQTSILYVDIDARFQRTPPFEELGELPMFPVWENPWGNKLRKPELLSGTLYFPYSKESDKILTHWREAQRRNPNVWDQKVLQTIYKNYKTEPLPLEWCYIPGMKEVTDPIILHTQASRKYKRCIT